MRMSATVNHPIEKDGVITEWFGQYTSFRPDMGRCVPGS